MKEDNTRSSDPPDQPSSQAQQREKTTQRRGPRRSEQTQVDVWPASPGETERQDRAGIGHDRPRPP